MNKPVIAYIGLGSNLSHPLTQLKLALKALAELPNSQLLKTSAIYQTPAIGGLIQPDYLNAAVKLQTTLSAVALLRQLQLIEQQQGRIRGEKWGPRTLDLDLLLYGEQSIFTQELMVPHPGIMTRNFVIFPLVDLEPGLTLPSGESLLALKAQCSSLSIKTIA
jgi:2-amino-4-hydroxy-6-hydroxymethyldihydropteridine diphosphokinase